MKLSKQIALLAIVALTYIHTPAQDVEQKPRQVWIRLKSGPILSGNLVKMDPDSVDFKVKGVLQSVKCDELIGVMFIPPTSRPNPAPTPTPTPTPAPVSIPAQTATSSVSQQQETQIPDRCVLDRRRPITLAGGQYNHMGFGNSLRDFHYRGSFNAQGGKISLYIIDAENYANLLNGKKFYSFYSAVKVTEGKFDIGFEKGNYHLVWWNESRYDARVIEAELCFSFPNSNQ